MTIHVSLHEEPTELFSPVTLPCGRVVVNRFVKAAMYEHGASFFGSSPNDYHESLYFRWSWGQWGMVITGNVQVSPEHLTLGRDITIPKTTTPETIRNFRGLASAIHAGYPETLAIMQLSHAGRQSPNILGGRFPFVRPLAPSSVRLGSQSSAPTGLIGGLLYRIMFQTPRPMNQEDINDVISKFVTGATVACDTGYDGIELHASHGYLLSQFISSKTNKRIDDYSAGVNSLSLLRSIISHIREIVPSKFVIGVKINVVDYIDRDAESRDSESGKLELALKLVVDVASWGLVDFIEISGGDYENPDFMETTPPASSSRQALFSKFSRQAMKTLSTHLSTSCSSAPRILLTGGLNNITQFKSALEEKHTHLLGMGRLSVIYPDLPCRILDHQRHDISNRSSNTPCHCLDDLQKRPDIGSNPMDRVWSETNRILGFPKLIGAGTAMAWYIVMMRRVADGREVDLGVGGVGAIVRMWLWAAPRSTGRSERHIWAWFFLPSFVVVGLLVWQTILWRGCPDAL